MSDQIECMCLQCGISYYWPSTDLAVLDDPGSDLKLLRDRYCEQCGGALMVRGKAHEEPRYKRDM